MVTARVQAWCRGWDIQCPRQSSVVFNGLSLYCPCPSFHFGFLFCFILPKSHQLFQDCGTANEAKGHVDRCRCQSSLGSWHSCCQGASEAHAIPAACPAPAASHPHKGAKHLPVLLMTLTSLICPQKALTSKRGKLFGVLQQPRLERASGGPWVVQDWQESDPSTAQGWEDFREVFLSWVPLRFF